jgi:hypothetical protein
MSNPTGPDRPDEPGPESADPSRPPESAPPTFAADAETEVFSAESQGTSPSVDPGERRFTAPSGFDAGSTQIIKRPAEPPTEVFSTTDSDETEEFAAQKVVAPQMIPPRGENAKPPRKRRSWGWVVAIVLVIAALAAIAILGTILLTRNSEPAVSQQEQVRTTIEEFDTAVQNGDLAKLRSMTCGTTRDNYVRYNDKTWSETHARVAAAKRYPVVASIDQIVVNGDHAEANVTTFMAYAPQTRSTRSFDLQFRDEAWKICQASSS